MFRPLLFLPIIVLASLGCSKDDDPPPVPSIANIQGLWVGPVADSQGQGNAAVTFSQSGTTASGTFVTNTTSGNISATVNSLTEGAFTVNRTQPSNCIGTYTGIIVINGNSMEVVYTGTDCNGPITGGYGALTRNTSSSSINPWGAIH